MCVIDHIEAYENTLSILGLDDDQSRINFLPWVFETKHRRFCESLKGLYGASWQEIKHRCHLNFGPYENVTAATAAIPNLRCNSNQSPNENLAVLKSASHVAEKEPDHNHPEFKSTFFEALPNYIKVSLGKDYKGGCSTESLVKESNNLYSIQQAGENKGGPEPSNKFVNEIHVSPKSVHVETQKKTYADIAKGDMPKSFPSRRPDTPPNRRGEQRPPREYHPWDPGPKFERNYRVYLPRVRFKPKGRHPHQCHWPRGPTQVNREQSQGRTPQNPRKIGSN